MIPIPADIAKPWEKFHPHPLNQRLELVAVEESLNPFIAESVGILTIQRVVAHGRDKLLPLLFWQQAELVKPFRKADFRDAIEKESRFRDVFEKFGMVLQVSGEEVFRATTGKETCSACRAPQAESEGALYDLLGPDDSSLLSIIENNGFGTTTALSMPT